jgi:uncharacterized membrane protein YhaH (DUF805 family)
MQLIHILFGFQGRIGRGQFWLAVLIWAVLYLAVIAGVVLFTSSLDTMLSAGVIAYVVMIILFIPFGLKRLHDRNKSGSWLLVFYGIPFALQFVMPVLLGDGDSDTTSMTTTLLQYVGFAISLWALVELGFLRGTIGGNHYGPDPVAPKPAHH